MKKTLKRLVLVSMILGAVFGNIPISATEIELTDANIEETTAEETAVEETSIKVVEEQQKAKEKKTTVSNVATTTIPTDRAFSDESRPLEQAIIAEYLTVDANNDGYISISEAQSLNIETMNLSRKGITGTINGIEYFNGVTKIYLHINELTGKIPESIGNLTNVKEFSVMNNKMEGRIPSSIASMTDLQYLYLSDNQFEGELPSELESLTDLRLLWVHNNKLSGVVPNAFGAMTHLWRVRLAGNTELTGNPVELFANNFALYELAIEGSGLLQAAPTHSTLEIANGGMFTYDNLAVNLLNTEKDDLAEGVTQAEIDRAQESANNWQEPNKGEWQANIDLAQDMLDAKNATDNLFDENGVIKAVVDNGKIQVAQDKVNELPEGSLKEKLQEQIKEAQNQLDARKAVDDLFNNDGTIKEGITQEDIDNARDLVDKVEAETANNNLQDRIDLAQDQLDAREAEKKVDDLTDENGMIKDETTQGDINNAQDAVDKLPDGSLKEELQDKINDVQDQLDEKNASFAIVKQFETYTGQSSVSAKIDAPASRVATVYLNGIALNSNSYTITNGSTVVTLNKEMLSALSNGNHTITVEYKAGKTVNLPLTVDVAKASEVPAGGKTNNTNDKVNTGENTNVNMLYGFALISFGAMLFVVSRKKKFNK